MLLFGIARNGMKLSSWYFTVCLWLNHIVEIPPLILNSHCRMDNRQHLIPSVKISVSIKLKTCFFETLRLWVNLLYNYSSELNRYGKTKMLHILALPWNKQTKMCWHVCSCALDVSKWSWWLVQKREPDKISDSLLTRQSRPLTQHHQPRVEPFRLW